MIKCCKIRIYPNKIQINIINSTLGCCNWIKNKYLELNIKRYDEDKSFISGYDFSKYINHLKKHNPDYCWIKEYSSKAIKDAIMIEESAFKRFFKTKKGFPKFKSRKRINKESFYFIKDNIHYIKKNTIKLPILGNVRITENFYLPELSSITSGRVIREYDKYYVMFIYNVDKNPVDSNDLELGIDVGLKNYATIAFNNIEPIFVKHFKDYDTYKELDKKIVRLQQIISNKSNNNYNRLLNRYMDKNPCTDINENIKNIMKGESYKSSRIRYLRKKIRNLKRRQRNTRMDFINKLVNMLTARIKPSMITIENLNISEMIKHTGTKDLSLHKYIQESSFYLFRTKLLIACEYFCIKLRIAYKYFASSKKCCKCGYKNKNLALKDRIFICP